MIGIRSFFAALLFSIASSIYGQGIVINELMASNEQTLSDASGSFYDWIELYNPSAAPVDLMGSFISDDPAQLQKHQFTGSLVVPPQGFLLLWASESVNSGAAHLPFDLSSSNGQVLLTASNGSSLIDNIQFGDQLTDVSFGRSPDGSSELRYFTQPSPEAPNSVGSAHLGILQPPIFSVQGGFFSAPFQLTLISPEPGTTILYTLDGSVPEMEKLNGAPFSYKNQYPELPGVPFGPLLQDTMWAYINSGPITINDPSATENISSARTTTYTYDYPPPYMPMASVRKAAIVRARVFREGYIPSEVVSNTYFFTPDAAPPFQLPVLSLSTDRAHLFDHEDGIYTAGEDFDAWRNNTPNEIPHGLTPANWHRDTEIPVGLQWFDEGQTTPAFSLNAGSRVHGAFSRSLKRKSLRLYFRSLYGQNELGHAIFPDQEVTGHKRLIIHNAGNDEGGANMRDMTCQSMMRSLRNETMDARSMVLFMNGEYWGVHALRERYDRHYFERKYGIEEGGLDMIDVPSLSVIEGDLQHYQAMVSFIANADVSQDTVLDQVAEMMDLDDFIDHLITHIFTGNTDWPQNNVRIYRKRTSAYVPDAPFAHDGRWRWLTFDLDYGFNLAGNITADLQFLERVSLPDGFGLDPEFTHIFRRLLLNQSFRDRFINRSADLINTAFRTSVTTAIINEHRDRIAADMQEHVTRWLSGPGSMAAWENELDVMYTFANARPSAFRQEIQNRFALPAQRGLTLNVSDQQAGYIHLNSIDILASTHGIDAPAYPWNGVYYQDVPITLTAHALPGFEFLYWTGDVAGTDPEITVQLTQATSITAVFGPVSYCPPELVHYWHFNALPNGPLSSIPADIQGDGEATISYMGSGAGYLDRTPNGEGTSVNAIEGVDAGRGLRVRNPSAGRSLLIKAPSLGYRDIELSFATTRTSNGPDLQRIWYTTDPDLAQWIPIGPSYMVIGNYLLHEFSLEGIVETFDQAHLAFRVEFLGDLTGGMTGNDRFDNVRLTGGQLPILEEEFCEGSTFTYDEVGYTLPGNYLIEIEGEMDCGSHLMLRLRHMELDTAVTLSGGGASVAEPDAQYQWLDCDAGSIAVEGETSQEFTPAVAGNYAVQITLEGCTSTSECHFIDPDVMTGITVYPNPVHDMLNVALPSNSDIDRYLLFDRAGRLLDSGPATSNRLRLDMRHLASGVYILELRGQEIFRKKVMR